jgi:four helix bundle protein
MCPLKKVPVVKKPIRKHTDLDVYQFGYAAGMRVFELSKRFPKEERYSLTDQIRRSSRSVCGNLAEGWRKR